MGHVICKYDHYSCSMHKLDCGTCDLQRIDSFDDSECYHLDCDPGYFEKTSKSIEFDGRVLIVGRSFFGYIDDLDCRPTAEDNVIEYLEIDGVVYCGEKEPVKGGTNEQENNVERESEDEGWEQVHIVQ